LREEPKARHERLREEPKARHERLREKPKARDERLREEPKARLGMRVVFAGTPEPALPSLRRLIESPRHDLVAVLTRPDAASGRRARPSPSPVAQLALERDIPVLRPPRPNSDEFVAELTELAPECCAVVAYGALLSDRLLAVPEHGWVNLHFSLLPAWRGAAPVQAAIAAGDTVTGPTTFQIEPSLDSGPVYGVVTEAIRPTDTAGDLLERLSISGAELLETTLNGIADGSLTAVPQPAEGVTIAPKITVEAARVRWDLPAHVVDRRIRAVTPTPGAWTMIGDLRVKVGPVTVDESANSLAPGVIRVSRDGVRIGTGSRSVRLGMIQQPGKKPMNAADWARGARLDESARAE
jgi:methionyl-tRNA formyltransferase